MRTTQEHFFSSGDLECDLMHFISWWLEGSRCHLGVYDSCLGSVTGLFLHVTSS